MRVKDLDDLDTSSRKPWLILVLLLAVGFLFLWKKQNEPVDSLEQKVDSAAQKIEQNTSAETPVQDEPSDGRRDVPEKADPVQMLEQAQRFEAKRSFAAAKRRYLDILQMPIDDKTRSDVERRVGKINTDLVMTPYAMPEKVDYVVKRGDSVDKIAKKFGTTVDLIAMGNNLKNPNLIKAGDRLRIFTGKFRIRVSKSDIDLVVYMNGEFFKRYRVGTGKYGKTPVGTFVLTEKQKEPVWWHPAGKSYQFGDPKNILGTRWMTLKATGDTPKVSGYGIHGTWEPESIGKAESAGCVRMRNDDVEELYTLLPEGTPVEIVE